MSKSEFTLRNCTFAFKCSAIWEDMETVSDEDTYSQEIRFCQECQKEVFFCSDDDDLLKSIRLNRCVAIDNLSVMNTKIIGEPIPNNYNEKPEPYPFPTSRPRNNEIDF
jgi:hypothetical protein